MRFIWSGGNEQTWHNSLQPSIDSSPGTNKPAQLLGELPQPSLHPLSDTTLETMNNQPKPLSEPIQMVYHEAPLIDMTDALQAGPLIDLTETMTDQFEAAPLIDLTESMTDDPLQTDPIQADPPEPSTDPSPLTQAPNQQLIRNIEIHVEAGVEVMPETVEAIQRYSDTLPPWEGVLVFTGKQESDGKMLWHTNDNSQQIIMTAPEQESHQLPLVTEQEPETDSSNPINEMMLQDCAASEGYLSNDAASEGYLSNGELSSDAPEDDCRSCQFELESEETPVPQSKTTGKDNSCLGTCVETTAPEGKPTKVKGLQKDDQPEKVSTKKCKLCLKTVSSSEFAAHKKSCKLECPFCGTLFRNRYTHKKHIKLKYWCSSTKKSLILNKKKQIPLTKIRIKQNVAKKTEAKNYKRPSYYLGNDHQWHYEKSNQSRDASRHKCENCGKTFKYFCIYKKHTQASICSSFGRTCRLCNQVFESRRAMLDHQKSDHQEDCKFVCTQCDKKFFTSSGLKEHVKHRHEGTRPHLCVVCGKSFCNLAGLYHHTKVHLAAEVQQIYKEQYSGMFDHEHLACHLCSKKLKKPMDWFYHMLKHQEDGDFTEASSDGLLGQFLDKNNKVFTKIAHPCQICHQVYFIKTRLEEHLKRHADTNEPNEVLKTIRRFQCQYCSCCFATKATLDRHVQHHTLEFQFLCDICSTGFSMEKHLHMHRHKSHQITHESLSVCPICAKLCPDKYRLASHIRAVHDKIKPFECSMCPKAFATKYSRDVHTRSHTKERPYACPVCVGKAWADRSNLIKHCSSKHPELDIRSTARTDISRRH